MKYFKSEDDEVFAYESDGSQDDYIRKDLVPINDEELAEIRAVQALKYAPTPEQVLASALEKRDALLYSAALRIAPLQDAADLDEATPAESASLKQWKQFRVAVNRVTSQAGFPESVEWPEAPSA